MINKPIIIALILLLNNTVYADDDSVVELQPSTVVAVANKQMRPIIDVIGSVSVITATDISNTNSENMADAIRYESNIQMENAGSRFGSSGINIRGIGKNRVAVEVDGISNAKQFSIGSFSHATAQFPETDLIKSIEILNGPASTLYGSDAIGGIVSVNTWDPEDLTALANGNRYNKIRLGYDGKTHGRVISALTAWNSDTFGSILSFTQRDGKGLITHDSVHSSRDFSDWDEQTFFTKFAINTPTSNRFELGLSATQRDNDTQINSFIGQGRFSRTSELLAKDHSSNVKFTLAYDFAINNKLFDDGIFRAYLANTRFEQDSFEKRLSRSGTPLALFRRFQYQQQNLGLEINLNKQIITGSSSHNLIYGLEFQSADIEELRDGTETNLITAVIRPSILGESLPTRDFPNSRINELGAFFLDEIVFADSAWSIIPAIRFDFYDLKPSRDAIFNTNGSDTQIVSINESDISPKLGVMYKINDISNIYLQYVRGFRAPPFDDVNIGLNIPLFNIRAIANPELKSETSNGLEMGYRYFGEDHQYNFTLFYTDYSDFIETKARIGIDPASGTLLFQSRNIDEAEIYGVEFSHSWNINAQLSSHSSLAWTRGNNKTSNQPINSVNPAKLIHNLQWQSLNNAWNVNLYSSFTRAVSRLDESNSSFFKPAGHVIFDLFIGHEISRNQHVKLALLNLADKKYWDWQQVLNFDDDEAIIDALSKPSRTISLSYTLQF
jgi:hemoglobin/transferrin/lactoferrin receptor protein